MDYIFAVVGVGYSMDLQLIGNQGGVEGVRFRGWSRVSDSAVDVEC